MKQTTLLIAMALLCAVAASALQISTPTIIGAKGAYASTTFTIYNDGSSTLNSFQITSSAESKYQISFQNIPSTLAPGQTSTVTIQGFVPVELVALQLIGNLNVNAYSNSFPNQGFYNQSNLPCSAGGIDCKGIYGSSSGTASIYMQPSGTTPSPTPTPTSNTTNTSSILKIDKVRLVCDKTKTVSDGSSIEVNAGQKCTLTVKIENIGDKDLEDIEIDVDADGDIDADSAEIKSLDEDDEKEVTISFEIDKDAEGDNDVTVTAEGEDEDGDSHKDSMSFTIEIDKPKHALEIDRFTISPSTVSSCNAGTVEVRVSVDNLGREDEDDASVELSVAGLGFTKKEDVEVQEGDSEIVTFIVPIAKGKSGSFTATARVFYDNTEADSDTQTFTVEKCVEAVTPVPQVKPEPPRSALPQNDIIVVPPKVEASFYDSTAFTVLLFVGNIVVLSVIGILVYNMFFRKKPDDLSEQFTDDKSYEELINPKDYY